jgi:hypothetical protein
MRLAQPADIATADSTIRRRMRQSSCDLEFTRSS